MSRLTELSKLMRGKAVRWFLCAGKILLRRVGTAVFMARPFSRANSRDRAAGDRLNALMRTQHILHEFSWRQLRQAGVASAQ